MMRNSSPLLFAAYYYTSIILSSCCCYAFNAWIVINGQWCGTQTKSTEWHRHRTHYHRQAIIVNVAAFDDTCIHEKNHFKTSTSYYNTILSADYGHVRRAGLFSRAASWIRRTKPSSSSSSCDDSILEVEKQQSAPIYRFTYDYNEMIIDSAAAIGQRTNSQQSITTTTGIMLIHPIGVGIGKWYYDRLFSSLLKEQHRIINNTLTTEDRQRVAILAPDLLGSATACYPTDIASSTALTKKLPLLNITDWSGQILHLMSEYETKCAVEAMGNTIDNWCIVANGGCSPIALHVAASSIGIPSSSLRAPVTHVILSSPPRLPFFLPNATTATDPNKVQKSYRTLSGVVGNLFWWYALRNNGKFIQKFSERNLVGNATNLGEDWTPNCIATARLHNGQSRYSTFAFLAGALQDGCVESLRILKAADHESNATITKIDFIRGTDGRRNRARSWFWTSRKRQERGKWKQKDGDGEGSSGSGVGSGAVEEMTIQKYIRNNGNRGKEVFVDGARISLAWENADEYAKRLLELCAD